MTNPPPTPPGKRYALCIGVGDYDNPDMALRFPAKDAKEIARWLKKQGNFPSVWLNIDHKDTTAEVIKSAIKGLLNGPDRKADDLALLYISGHGGTFGESKTFYLCGSDFQLDENGRPVNSSVMTTFDLAGLFNECKVKNVIIWLDLCHAGGAIELTNVLGYQRTAGRNIFIGGAARHSDPTLELGELGHGVFTFVLLEAFQKLKPSRQDGFLTLGEVQIDAELRLEEIRKRPEYTDLSSFPVELRAENMLSLPLVKNPHYSLYNQDFLAQVQDLLKVDGYRLESPSETSEELPGYFVAIKDSYPDEQRFGYLVYDNEVVATTPNFIEQASAFLKNRYEEEVFEKIRIITQRKLEIAQQQAFTKQIGVNRKGIVFYRTESEILAELVKFEKCLKKWSEEFTQKPRVDEDLNISLSQVYIPLQAEKRIYRQQNLGNEPDFGLHLGKNKEEDKDWQRDEDNTDYYKVEDSRSLDELLARWLKNPDSSQLALLGNYGTGKSTYSLYLTARLHQAKAGRIPIFLPLRLRAKAELNIRWIAEYIAEEANLDRVKPEALERLAKAGRLLFILDGFDEMATQADSFEIKRNILNIEKLAGIPNNKVLLTTRPEYFVQPGSEGELLKKYERLYLVPFKPEEIEGYLVKRVGAEDAKKAWDKICQIYDLKNLAERPVFLEMIVKVLPKIHKSEIVNRPALYQHYLVGELERQRLKDRPDLKISNEKRLAIMEALALELYHTGKYQEGLTVEEVHRLFRDNPVLSLEERNWLELTTQDILTCSFLFNPQGKYYFSHRSFQEYLLARCLHRALSKKQPEDFERGILSAPTLEFLAEMLIAGGGKQELSLIQQWLTESTAQVGQDGQVKWGPFQQNLAGLLLAYRVLGLAKEKASDYITCAEFQLFIEEQNKKKSYPQPAHWSNFRFEAGQANNPVLGVSANSAENFCIWLSSRHLGSFEYKLPEKELEVLPGFENITSWNGKKQLARLNAETEVELKKQINKVSGYADLDLANTRAIALDLDFAIALDLDFDLDFDFDFDLALALDLDFDLASTRSLGRDRDRVFVRIKDKKSGFEELANLLNMGEKVKALNEAKRLSPITKDIYDNRTLILITDLLEIETAASSQPFRILSQAHLNYVKHFAEIVIEGYRLLKPKPADSKALKELENMARLQGWVEMIEARIHGRLPAWEGVRITKVGRDGPTSNKTNPK